MVYERDQKGRTQTTQKIEIYFNLIGQFIPPTMETPELTQEEGEELQKREERKDRLHRNYLRRKANGVQKAYEERVKIKRKEEINAKKEAERAIDRENGIYYVVADMGIPKMPKPESIILV